MKESYSESVDESELPEMETEKCSDTEEGETAESRQTTSEPQEGDDTVEKEARWSQVMGVACSDLQDVRRNLQRVVVLVDMDCFYVQVEQHEKPELRGKPCAVVQYNAWKGGG